MQGSRENMCLSDAGTVAQEHAVPAPLEAAWETIRAGLRRDCGARTFDGWLKPAELGAFDGESGELEVVMPSQFMADWVQSHFGERLSLAWRTVLPIVRGVRVVAAPDGPKPAPLLVLEEIPAAPASPAQRDPSAPNFDPRYCFETFVVGKANEVACTAAWISSYCSRVPSPSSVMVLSIRG